MNKEIISTIGLILIISHTAFAENTWNFFAEKGNTAYNNDDYTTALRFYQKAVDRECADGIIWYRYSYSNEQVNGFNDSYWLYYEAYTYLAEQYPDNKYLTYTLNKLFGESDLPGDIELFFKVALRLNLTDYADKYLEKIDNVNKRYHSYSNLHEAVSMENTEIVSKLLEKRADPNYVNSVNGERTTALFDSVIKNNTEITSMLLDYGADLDEVIKYNNNLTTPFLYAIENNQNEILISMLDHGADVDKGKEPESISMRNPAIRPLFTAVVSNNNQGLKLLLEYGADIEFAGREHETSLLSLAIFNGNHTALDLLLNYGADPDAVYNEEELPPVTSAVIKEDDDALQMLIDYGADLETAVSWKKEFEYGSEYTKNSGYYREEFKDESLFTFACIQKNSDAMRILLKNGISATTETESIPKIIWWFDDRNTVFKEDNWGTKYRDTCIGSRSLLAFSLCIDNPEITEILISNGAEPDYMLLEYETYEGFWRDWKTAETLSSEYDGKNLYDIFTEISDSIPQYRDTPLKPNNR